MSKRRLLIATRSKGKFPEIVAALSGLPFEFVNLNDIPEMGYDYEVEEPAMSFKGNAIIKAMTLGKRTSLLTLADDSGLEVDALGDRPGVYSARYAPGSDKDRNDKLLTELNNVPTPQRKARFKAVIAIYDPANDKIRTCEGVCEGKIALEPKGNAGFGYDPIFINAQLSKTNAELSLEEKNRVSHRGQALHKARNLLETEFI